MEYNIHPMIVHFPIALLILYTVIKVLPLKKWIPSVAWKNVEQVLLFFGVLGALAASASGEGAEHFTRADEDIIDMHEYFASSATWFYGILLIGEVVSALNRKIVLWISVPLVIKVFAFVERILTHKVISVLLALLGFIALTLTGVLGGVMVHGLTADPIAPFVMEVLQLGK